MSLGLLLRSPISAISIGVAWLLVIENIIAATVKGSGRWMPGQLITTISTGGDGNSSYSHAILIVFTYLAIAALGVAILFKRRDVAN